MGHTLKKDFIITFITEFIVLIGGLLVYKFAAKILGEEGFSEYTLSRRIISFLLPLLLLSTSVGIPRYISFSNASTDDHKNSDNYFVAGICIVFSLSIIGFSILNLFSKQFAFLLFSDESYSYLIFPVCLMINGLILHGLTYSYFRGNLQMTQANLLKIINMGIFPIVAFAMGKSTATIIGTTGLLITVNSLLFMLYILKSIEWKSINNIFICAKELVVYGYQRLPGDFSIAALLALPATITAHYAGVTIAGHVAFATSLITLTGAAFAPIGLILLPQASRIIANKEFALLKKYIHKLLLLTISITLFGTLIFEFFTEEIITIYLGKSFTELNLITKIMMLAGVPYVIFVTMRSIIDAYYVKSLNAFNLFVALVVFLGMIGLAIFFGFDQHSIAFVLCFVIAIYTLSGLTLITIFNIIKKTNN